MSKINVFNSPIEVGLRSLIILNTIKPDLIDIDRLVIYDYLVLHTEDIDKQYKSLHPSTPHRSGELLVRRELLQKGINLMASRELLDKHYLDDGIYYSANSLTGPFINYFESNYSVQLREYMEYIKAKFHHLSANELKDYVIKNLDVWGGEFEYESILRRDIE